MQEELAGLRQEKTQLQEEHVQLQQALEDQALATEQQIRTMAAMSDEAAEQMKAEQEGLMTQMVSDHQNSLDAAEKTLLKSEVGSDFALMQGSCSLCNHMNKSYCWVMP